MTKTSPFKVTRKFIEFMLANRIYLSFEYNNSHGLYPESIYVHKIRTKESHLYKFTRKIERKFKNLSTITLWKHDGKYADKSILKKISTEKLKLQTINDLFEAVKDALSENELSTI